MAETRTQVRCRPSFMKIVVPDAEEAVAFYEQAFGMARTETLDFPTIVEIKMEVPGDTFEFILFSRKGPHEIAVGNGWGPIGFDTDQFDALLERVLAAGATTVTGPGELDGMRYVIVRSPHGHEIEILQRPAA